MNLLLKRAHDILLCEDGAAALKHLEQTPVDLVLASVDLPLVSGFELIERGKKISPGTAFVVLVPHGAPQAASESIRHGAEDYFLKPFDVSEVEHRIRRIEEFRSMRIKGEYANHLDSLQKFLIGVSPNVEEARSFINAAALADSPVVLYGPPGSGKKHVARLIHESGPRAIYPFITVDCANVDAEYVDAELFGYEKGAFRGATSPKAGKLEFARAGTLLLEDIEGLSPSSQRKLSRLLRERYFERLGGERKIHTNVRLIVQSHDNLKEKVLEGKFDAELYAHLNLLTFEMTGLSSRREDIPLLIEHFCRKVRQEWKREISLAPDTIEAMCRYAFPGNTKELQNLIEHLATASPGKEPIGPDKLPPEFQTGLPEGVSIADTRATQTRQHAGLEEMLQAFELEIIMNALEKTGNDEHQAAVVLKISHATLVEKLKKYGFSSSEKEKAA